MILFKNREPLSLQFIIEYRGLCREDIRRMGIPKSTLHDIIYANGNISFNTLDNVGRVLKIRDYIHWLHALDRLYVISDGRKIINPQTIKFPYFLPAEIQHLILNRHPIFKDNESSKLRSYIMNIKNIMKKAEKINSKMKANL